MWSIGAILYTMLVGRPPFDGKDDREIIKKVRDGTYNMDQKALKKKCPECKDFIKQLLMYDPKRRLSAVEAMKHPWIHQYRQK